MAVKSKKARKKKRLADSRNLAKQSKIGVKTPSKLSNASSRKTAKATKLEAEPVKKASVSVTGDSEPTGVVKGQKTVLTTVKNGWVPNGETVVIAERKIPGMVYIFDSTTVKENDRRLKSKVYIDTSKLVGGRDKQGFVLNSFLYGEMEPANRASYLDWLAAGKLDTDFHPAYPLMYIYGLERRLLFDKTSDKEKQDIVKELVRLNKVFSGVYGIDNEVQGLLNFAELLRNPYNSKLITYPNDYLNFPPKLLIDLSNLIFSGEKLTAENLLDWYSNVPTSKFDVQKLKNSSFRDKFLENFYLLYGNGMAVESPGKFLQLEYKALSGEFKIAEQVLHEGRPVLDIRILKEPLNIAHKIATKSVRQSKFRGQEFMPVTNLKALGVLAKDSGKKLTPSQAKKYEFLRIWAAQLETDKTRLLARDVVANSLLETVKSITIDQWERTNIVFSTIGFGIAPNTLLYMGAPRRHDPVFIYDLVNEHDVDFDYSLSYYNAMVELGICSHLMHTLNLSARSSKAKLLQFVKNISGLADYETAGLHANIEYLMNVPPDKSYLARMKKRVGAELGSNYRSTIVDFVKDGDHYDTKTITAVEKVYRALCLDRALAYPDLHEGKIFAVSAETKKEMQKSAETELNEKLVESIKADTEKVSKLLGDIFVVDGQDQQETEMVAEDSQDQAIEFAVKGLDKNHLGFLNKLVEKEFWPEDSFAKLAKKFGLLPVGAAETINEWTFERYDDSLLDEQDGFYVAANIAKSLKTELKKGLM